MSGRSDFVRFAFHPHRNSQASSRGQIPYLQAVTPISDDCEANFIKGRRKKNINRNTLKCSQKHRGKKRGILSSQRSQAH